MRNNMVPHKSLSDMIRNNPFDRFFDNMIKNGVFMDTNNRSFPKYNIVKSSDENRYTIEMALAGFTKDEVTASISKGILTVKGEKNEVDDRLSPDPTEGGNMTSVDAKSDKYVVKGISNRSFEIHFQVSNETKVESAKMENGMLYITIVKLDQDDHQPIQIE